MSNLGNVIFLRPANLANPNALAQAITRSHTLAVKQNQLDLFAYQTTFLLQVLQNGRATRLESGSYDLADPEQIIKLTNNILANLDPDELESIAKTFSMKRTFSMFEDQNQLSATLNSVLSTPIERAKGHLSKTKEHGFIYLKRGKTYSAHDHGEYVSVDYIGALLIDKNGNKLGTSKQGFVINDKESASLIINGRIASERISDEGFFAVYSKNKFLLYNKHGHQIKHPPYKANLLRYGNETYVYYNEQYKKGISDKRGNIALVAAKFEDETLFFKEKNGFAGSPEDVLIVKVGSVHSGIINGRRFACSKGEGSSYLVTLDSGKVIAYDNLRLRIRSKSAHYPIINGGFLENRYVVINDEAIPIQKSGNNIIYAKYENRYYIFEEEYGLATPIILKDNEVAILSDGTQVFKNGKIFDRSIITITSTEKRTTEYAVVINDKVYAISKNKKNKNHYRRQIKEVDDENGYIYNFNEQLIGYVEKGTVYPIIAQDEHNYYVLKDGKLYPIQKNPYYDLEGTEFDIDEAQIH